jgi:hypothetical protein
MVVFDSIGVWEAFAKQVRIADVGDLTPVTDMSIEEERGSVGGFDRPGTNREIRKAMLAAGRTRGQAAPCEVTRLKVAEGREFKSA